MSPRQGLAEKSRIYRRCSRKGHRLFYLNFCFEIYVKNSVQAGGGRATVKPVASGEARPSLENWNNALRVRGKK